MQRSSAIVFTAFSVLMGTAVAVMAEGTTVRFLPVPADTIMPGELITVDRLTERQFRTTPRSVAGIAKRPVEVVGREARRRLLAGSPIQLAGLSAPLAVKRGAMAPAIYREDDFSISTQVVALSDGVEGDVIDARAVETGAVIKVEVLPGGDLQVAGE